MLLVIGMWAHTPHACKSHLAYVAVACDPMFMACIMTACHQVVI
jgi:hypothetical protein